MKKSSAKKRILQAVFALLVIASIAVLGWALYGRTDTTDGDTDISAAFYKEEPGAVHVLENEHLKLELDADTTHFTITTKADDHVWRAVPEDAARDPIALAGSKNLLQSTLALTYSTDNGVRTLYDNFEYSIKNQVYEITANEDEIRVDYTLGRITRAYFIPEVILVERMDAFLSGLTRQQSRKVLDSYRKYDPAKIKENQREELFNKYPKLEEGAVYALRDNVKDFLKEEFEGLFESIGYTYEDYQQDQADTGTALSNKTAIFNVSVIYRLDGPDFLVKVPFDSINYTADFPPIRLGILPNFGAGSTQDTGYMLMPEGGGGLIRFNNGKTRQNGYFANVYGWDYASYRSAVVHETNARFPMFAMVNNGSAFLCMMEDHAANASLSADIAGRGNSYNTASASFNLLHSDAFNVTDRTIETIYMYEQGLPQGAITQRYRFLPTDDYVTLAKAYRAYLMERYPGLVPLTAKGLPLAVEIIGAIDKVQQRGGLPVSLPISLTNYQQTAEIVKDIASATDSRLHVRLSGWMNGGIKQTILKKDKLISQLGTASDFEQMVQDVKDTGARLYLNGVTSFALDSGVIEGFLPLRDAARFTTREAIRLYKYSNVWYGTQEEEDQPYYLLKPEVSLDMMRNLATAAQRHQADGVSYEDVGALLSADYNPKQTVTRDEAAGLQTAEQARVKQEGLGVMIRGGNLYALEHADLVTNTDLRGVPYFIMDEAVPFIHIALHGLVEYTGKPINLTGDWEQEILLSAQRGAGLSFVFMAEEPLVLHDTTYSEYFGASYALWEKEAKEIIKQYEQTLGHTFHQAITNYECLEGEVTITTYEDGTRVAVNLGNEDQTVDGQVVSARSYHVLEGGSRP